MKNTVTPRPKSESAPAVSGPAPSAPNSPKPAAPSGPSKFTPRGSSKQRILLAINDGKIDFRAMSPEANKLLNEALHTPEVQAQFGLGPLAQQFDPQHCVRLYQALGRILESSSRFALRWPSQASEKLLYSEAECKELAGPTARLLDQYGNKFILQNQAAIALAITFGAITQAKIQAAAQVLKAEAERRNAPGPTERPGAPAGPQPIVRTIPSR